MTDSVNLFPSPALLSPTGLPPVSTSSLMRTATGWTRRCCPSRRPCPRTPACRSKGPANSPSADGRPRAEVFPAPEGGLATLTTSTWRPYRCLDDRKLNFRTIDRISRTFFLVL